MERKCFELEMWALYRARHEEEIVQARRSIEELKEKEKKCRLDLFQEHYGANSTPLGVLQGLETRVWECFDEKHPSLKPPPQIILERIGEVIEGMEKFLIPTQEELDAYWCLFGTSMIKADEEK